MAKHKRITLKDIMNKLDEMEGEFQDLKRDVQNLKEDVQNLRGEFLSLKGDVLNLKGDFQNLRGEFMNLKIFVLKAGLPRKGPRKNIYWADTIGVGSSVHGPTYLDPRVLKD